MTCLRVLTASLAVVAAQLVFPKVSYADPCGALRNGAASPELAQLRRQLAAIQGIERQRHCTASSATGGFFNACADLARGRAEVQRRIAGVGNPGRDDLQARYVALGCQSAARRQPAEPKSQPSATTFGSNAMLFCVRLSDGYFFPAPNSQFARGNGLKHTVDQCRYICDDAGVDLYTLSDPNLETDQMVAVETRMPYTELPTAFRYRDDASFKACDLKRYYQRVVELRARTVTPGNMQNAIIPLPTAKPDLTTVSDIPAPGADGAEVHVTAAADDAAQQTPTRPASSRQIRMVGPAFFPAD
ncbi:DUF2865 domain-containing protein [Mesorhizobium sp. VK23B]|uniref:DUF2865 domain-containing protein n=1 Tax=Mesorhizobium dulcispinae TaxID=3072316 RepID=A0ABU4XAS5_9HYPH|nr:MULTISPECIES: DUF2865 domain-containing protein [unclassified Mesorhizobium]MDX8465907.1 DUF2865 domain-containing protein [Mesorhizobium sp. VK23B]MDX8471291.1 DUF2865 domain-containing protein [Mesorhizobium sp. VK23A]